MLSSMARPGGSGRRRRNSQGEPSAGDQQQPQQQRTVLSAKQSRLSPVVQASNCNSTAMVLQKTPVQQQQHPAAQLHHLGHQIRTDTGRNDYYTVLTPEDLWDSMQRVIDSAAEVLHLPRQYIRLLLRAFRWDKDRLLDSYYEADPDEFLAKYHIPQQQQQQQQEKQPHSSAEMCEICLAESPSLSGAGCGHRFCSDCWTAYLEEKMASNGQFDAFQCPAHRCPAQADDFLVDQHLINGRLRSQYRRSILQTYVSNTRRLAPCPGLDCDMAVSLTDDTGGLVCRVTCRCGKSFCFACGNDWHEPIGCEMLRRWLQKNEGESMNTQWFLVHTKPCPKCHATIEKDGGCNHMVCRNVSCRYEFCWVCMGEWQPHGNQWYNCNRFDKDRADKLKQAQAVSRDYLVRYLHYYDLYMNHRRSMELESRLIGIISAKMTEIQQAGLSWVECRFLRDAVDALCKCRRVLMYTYVFAYYLKPSNQQRIFEDNQRNLQLTTEALSEVLERELDLANLQRLKQNVQDRYRYCTSRAAALLQHVYEGYQGDWWTFDMNGGQPSPGNPSG
ncbi:hypothetical protein BOX15_Mlig002420g1 [Macrostomum lignano]|uniref:RBR-type E3 ubiquitin transferase n=1 Tax=Macrostomum lignano TaxID=282301 RepID=A0A267FX30_9PLAT|nr:hypothetical protein BOX15_Mlig002420g1 [Macrostomum lignano]